MMLRLAFGYLLGHRKQYALVIAIIMSGVAFIFAASGLAAGMSKNVEDAALRHYAGHVFVMGRDRDAASMIVVDDFEAVSAALRRINAPVERMVLRTHEFGDATLFFAGETVRIKDLFGVDFSDEADLFSGFDYSHGQFNSEWASDTIVISRATADQLRVAVGDRLIVRLPNRSRQIDTRDVVVRGIINDNSIYGYARAYMDRRKLAELMGIESGVSVVGLFLGSSARSGEWSETLRAELSKSLPVSSPIGERDDLTSAIRETWNGVQYFVFPLSAYISDVSDLLQLMRFGSYVLLAMIVTVVIAAMLVSYRVLLHDREREIGTMRAIGFERQWLIRMLVTESVLAVTFGVVAGIVAGSLLLHGVSHMSFDSIPGFEIFLRGGRLTAEFTASQSILNGFILYLVTVPAVAFMITRTVCRSVPSLIRGGTV